MAEVFRLEASVAVLVGQAIQALRALEQRVQGTERALRSVSVAATALSSSLQSSLTAASTAFQQLGTVVNTATGQAGSQINLLAHNLHTAMTNTAQAMSQVTGEVRNLLSSLSQLSQRMGRVGTAAQQAGGQVQNTGRRLRQSGSEFAEILSLLGAGALARGVTGTATEFDQAMRNVNAVLQQSEPRFDQLRRDILSLTKNPDIAAGPIDIAKALFTVAQAGYDAEESTRVVLAAAQAASAGMTDTETAINGLIAVMKTYNITAAEVQKASDFLFQTYLDGAISFEELSRQIGIVLGIAKQAGVQLEEVGAAISVATIRGFQSGRAFTALRQAISHLTGPTEANLKLQKQYGIYIDQSTIKLDGLAKTFDKVYRAVGQSQEALKDLLGDVDAAALIATLAADEFDEFNQKVVAQKNNVDATDRAWAQVAQGTQTHINKMKASIEKMVITLSNSLIPVMKRAADGVGRLAEAVANMSGGGQALIFWAGSALLGFLALGNGIRLFSTALESAKVGMGLFIATPMAATLTAIGAAAGVAMIAIEAYRQSVEETARQIKAEADATVALAKARRELPPPPIPTNPEDLGLSDQRRPSIPNNSGLIISDKDLAEVQKSFDKYVDAIVALNVKKRESEIIEFAAQLGKIPGGVQKLTSIIKQQEATLASWRANYDQLSQVIPALNERIIGLAATLAANKRALQWLQQPVQLPLLNEIRKAQAEYVAEMNRKTSEAIAIAEKFNKLQDLDVFSSSKEELTALKDTINQMTSLSLRGPMAETFKQFQQQFEDFGPLFSTADTRKQVELLLETMKKLREEALKLPDMQRKKTLEFLDVLEELAGERIRLEQKTQDEIMENERKYHSERIKNRLLEIDEARSGAEERIRLTQEEMRVVVNGEVLAQGMVQKTATLKKISTQEALNQLRSIHAETLRLHSLGLVSGEQVREVERKILAVLKEQNKERQEALKLEVRSLNARADAINLEIALMKKRNASEAELIAKVRERLQTELQALEKEKKLALEKTEDPEEKAVIEQEYQNERVQAELKAENDIQSIHEEALQKQEQLTSLRNELRQGEISALDRMLDKLSEQAEAGGNTSAIYQQQEALLKKRLDLQLQSIRAETEAAAASAEAAGEFEKAALIRQKGEMQVQEAIMETHDTLEKLKKEAQGQTKVTGGRILTLEEMLAEQSAQFGTEALGKSPFQSDTDVQEAARKAASDLRGSGFNLSGTETLSSTLGPLADVNPFMPPGTQAPPPKSVGPAVQTTRMEVEFKASGEIKVTNPGPLSDKTAQMAAEELARKFYTAGDRSSGLGRNV